MKKVLMTAITVVGFFSGSVVAFASPSSGSTYGGVQYALGNYNEDGVDELNPTALIGRFGKHISDGFSIEGRLGIGLQDDSIVDPYYGIEVSLELDTLLGVYGVGHININESSSVYGLVGLTRAEATAKVKGYGVSVSDDDSGISYGIGADIGISNDVSLNIEYTQYLNKSDFDFSAFGLGVVFDF